MDLRLCWGAPASWGASLLGAGETVEVGAGWTLESGSELSAGLAVGAGGLALGVALTLEEGTAAVAASGSVPSSGAQSNVARLPDLVRA